jgi:thiol-disulfide isomerase/thioredoxin
MLPEDEFRTSRLSRVVYALVALGLVMCAALLGWRLGRSGTGHSPVERLAELRLPSLDGTLGGPADHRGQVVLLDFWASWCNPCRAQAKVLELLAEDFPSHEVQFFAVNVGESAETVSDYVASAPFPYPVLLDETGETSSEIGVYGLPTVMVLDREGQLVFSQSGIRGRGELAEVLRSALDAPTGG